MYIRKLCKEDAPLMLEWMHDPSCVEFLQAKFADKTVEDCEAFIAAAQDDTTDLHLAIADSADTYMGTVSLKHIDRETGTAEFAISMHSAAMGKGYAGYGMRSIIDMGLGELGLKQVYWCVSPLNKRAVRFYDKNGYQRVDVSEIKSHGYTKEQEQQFIWYAEYK